jgi:glycosyltransferase involved in cell wall biosynthesis
LRVLQALGWYYPENVGGTEKYVATLSRLLKDAGNEVVIAAPLAGALEPRVYIHEGLTVFRYPIPSAPSRDEAQSRVPARGSEQFREWLMELKPDIAHFHSIVTGLGLHEMRAAREIGARVIFTSHASSLGYICQRGTLMRLGAFPCDGLTEIVKCSVCELQHRGLPRAMGEILAREPVELSRILGVIDNSVGTALGMPDLIARNRKSQQEMLEIVEAFVVLTQSAAAIARRNGAPESKLFVNELGITACPGVRKPGPEMQPTSPPVRLGYLGRFDLVKGVVELARALRALPFSTDFVFEFRGPVSGDPDRAVLEELRRICEGDSRIRFAPGVAPAEVFTVLEGYDALVCPSICAEGGPTVAIEAQSVGTPVVGTRIGGLAELVDDGVNGSLVPAGDVEALSAMLLRIVKSPGETIDRWRRALPAPRTMAEVAGDYAGIYAERVAGR